MKRAIGLLSAGLVGLLLSGCVTTSTGGLQPPREDQALQDYLQLSAAYLEQGDLVNVRRHLDNALRIDPNNSEAYGLQGLLHARQGDDELADQSFQRALRLNRDNSQVRNNYAAFLFSNGRYREAYEQLQVVVQDTGYLGRAQAFENLGLAALQLDRHEDAADAFSRALRLDSNRYRASLELAALSLDAGEAAQARTYYRNYDTVRQFRNLPPSPQGLWVGARLERALGNEEAARQYGMALERLFSTSDEYQQYLQSQNDE